MESKGFLKGMSILAFAVSAYFSIIALTSSAYGIAAVLVMVCVGLIIETSKVTSLITVLTGKTKKNIRITCGILYVVLLAFSIFFSMCFVSNGENHNRNETALNSTEYTQQQVKITTDTDSITRLNEQIDTITAQNKEAVKAKNDYISSLPSNYRTERKKALNDITQLNKDKNTTIGKLNDKIETSEKSKKGTLSTDIKAEVKDSTGFTANLKTVQTFINDLQENKNNPLTLDQISWYFYFLLSIAFEIAASLLWVLSGNNIIMTDTGDKEKSSPIKTKSEPSILSRLKKKVTPNSNPITNVKSDVPADNSSLVLQAPIEIGYHNFSDLKSDEEGSSDKPIIGHKDQFSASKKIGFDIAQKTDKQYKLKKFNVASSSIPYRKCMEQYANGNVSTKGYIAIGKLIGLSQSQANEIFGYLKTSKIVEVLNKKTIILKRLNNAK